MRIWDIHPNKLCRLHILGEHRELHALWVILTENKKGYRNHPETIRWRGKLRALYLRHEKLVKEMLQRGYRHNSFLARHLASGSSVQKEFVNSLREQLKIIRDKKCGCKI